MAKSIFCGRGKELDRLSREWGWATEAQGQPQVVVMLADNGLGNARAHRGPPDNRMDAVVRLSELQIKRHRQLIDAIRK